MKGLVFLAFFAFVASLYPNSVEAGKCYFCGEGENIPLRLSCENFLRANDCERKKRFTAEDREFDDPELDLDCSQCRTITQFGILINLACSIRGHPEVPSLSAEGKAFKFCEGDLCNGPNGAESSDAGGRCYACAGKSCEDFESEGINEEEKRCNFSMKGSDLPLLYDCSKCMTLSKDGKVRSRSCVRRGLDTHAYEVDGEKLDVCYGDFCNRAPSSTSTFIGRCYACSFISTQSCAEFDRSCDKDRKKKFLQDSNTATNTPSDCTQCHAMTSKGKVIVRRCVKQGEDISTITEGEKKSYYCSGDLCNGGDAESFDGAGSLNSWATVTFLSTVASLLKGLLF